MTTGSRQLATLLVLNGLLSGFSPAIGGAERIAPGSIESLLRAMAPRVVSLRVERAEPEPEFELSRGQLRLLPPAQKEELRRYFTRPSDPVSGLLLDRDGHILTSNYNVSGKIKKIEVLLPESDPRPAAVRARDPVDDVALVQLNDPLPVDYPLPELHWGDPDGFLAGRFVLAVGRSSDPRLPTATLGIISAPERNNGRAIQTDAALNYGNSGGPMIGLDGKVIGIAGFIGHAFPHWGMNSGVGFGTRADVIQDILPRLVRGEDIQRIQRPLLGVMRARNEPDDATGARVFRVVEGSAASAAGMKDGDVIVGLDGLDVEDFAHLRHLIARRKPGDEVSVRIRRDDATLELEVVLGKAEEEE